MNLVGPRKFSEEILKHIDGVSVFLVSVMLGFVNERVHKTLKTKNMSEIFKECFGVSADLILIAIKNLKKNMLLKNQHLILVFRTKIGGKFLGKMVVRSFNL